MAAPTSDPLSRELERVVREALASIRFGTVTLVVQDGRVIQVDKNEKIRLNRAGHVDGGGI
ncbi:YezD family protein [Geomesophilobacter sediminis]|uniref:YezD family protein n=1 Tax=Geomesophilobacter sediminis TaxID=2798584 RepID=A0A8J7JDG2_9BACT|nr:YezD family protein [Geomesophilobacter sediminis]MBJ6725153.1 YezD family protein [Geomesophilobacter sediminis]